MDASTSARTLTPAPEGGADPVPGRTCPEGWFDGWRTDTLQGDLEFWRARGSAGQRAARRKAATLLADDPGTWGWLPTGAHHAAALELELRLRAEGTPN
jgi:hypothetical protein